MRAPAALLATFLALLGQLGTGDAQSSADTRSPTPSASSVRLVPPLDGAEVATLGVESDGTRRLLSYGLRLLARPDGSVETASEFFPLARNVQAIELPERLGRGFLFSLVTAGRTALWKAPSFTGKLEPFAELSFEVERIVAGFDRVYVQAKPNGEWAALDARTGHGMDLGSLPRSPNFGAMAFVDEWFGAVELPVRGTVVSFDAGNRWHSVGLSVMGLGRFGGELLLVTPDGRRALGPDGALRTLESGNGELDSAEHRVIPEGPFGAIPLRTAVLRGFPESPEVAVVASRGALGRIRLRDGRVLAVREKALSPTSQCTAVRVGEGFGFVCSEPQGKTRLFAFEPPLSVRALEEFESPRAINESGNGALVIRGSCRPKARDARSGTYCIRTPKGERWELAPEVPDQGTERVVALGDGGAAWLVPPRPALEGTLTVTTANRKTRSLPLSLEGVEPASQSLLKKGFWLDGWVESRDGSLRGWVTGQGVFVGVRINREGSVRTGPIQRNIERVILSGERALVIPAMGVAEQTTNGGQSYTEVDLPVEIDTDPSKAVNGSLTLEQGCSRLGCAFLGWLRVGWNGPRGSEPLVTADAPSPTRLPGPGGGRWLLHCTPTGDVSPRVAPAPPPERSESSQRTSWLPLLEAPAPVIPREAVGFDTGNAGQLRGYAWAPRGADFGKSGKFTLSVADRFRVQGGVWSTAPSPSPWTDMAHVAEVFGYESASPSSWSFTLDSGGRAGILAITARGSTELFAVEEKRRIDPLVNASRQGVGAVTSSVRIGSTFYVAAQEEGKTYRIFALESGRARLVTQFSDVPFGRSIAPTLVRSTRGDALGIWGRGSGWFVFPLDLTNGRFDAPLEISARELAHMPAPCAPDEEGYLLEGVVGLDPYADLPNGENLGARGFEGRFVVGPRGICVSELTARTERVPTWERPRASSSPKASVPLVLSERSEGGRRWGFRCAP